MHPCIYNPTGDEIAELESMSYISRWKTINRLTNNRPELFNWDLLSDRAQGKGLRFERIRRITGYLVGTLDRFNDAKRSEESERVKHAMSTPVCND